MKTTAAGYCVLDMDDVSGTTEELNGALQAMLLRRQKDGILLYDGADVFKRFRARKKEIAPATRQLIRDAYADLQQRNFWMSKDLWISTRQEPRPPR